MFCPVLVSKDVKLLASSTSLPQEKGNVKWGEIAVLLVRFSYKQEIAHMNCIARVCLKDYSGRDKAFYVFERFFTKFGDGTNIGNEAIPELQVTSGLYTKKGTLKHNILYYTDSEDKKYKILARQKSNMSKKYYYKIRKNYMDYDFLVFVRLEKEYGFVEDFLDPKTLRGHIEPSKFGSNCLIMFVSPHGDIDQDMFTDTKYSDIQLYDRSLEIDHDDEIYESVNWSDPLNSPYYDDNLDMDQQSPEFWDSL